MIRSGLLLFLLSLSTVPGQAQQQDTLYLWPGAVPGEDAEKHPPVRTRNQEGNTTRLTDVTDPAVIVFEPEPSLNNGWGVVVL